ncbi:uncharacterized protein [Mytilus edulis]|uniref:uncharacterized protein n=1 Tax=Mytilus edulis TaxID=6550 RepID=UPI0039F01CA8
MKRRWSLDRKDQESNGRKRLTHRNKTDEDEDGLKDNALYESAGQDYVPKQGPSGVEYAVVTKNKEKFQLNGNKNIQETVLHTDVKKSGNDVKANCKAKKGNNKQRKKHYRADNATNCPEKNINKDGLVYADLDLNPSPNGPKFIHGIDDRTIYAMVDTTQKIDPLPDSDEENEDEKSI